MLIEEQGQADYVCWLKNPPRKPLPLYILYEMGGEQKPAYPDFVIIRNDSDEGYVVDILESHDSTRIDNLGKTRGGCRIRKIELVCRMHPWARMQSDIIDLRDWIWL